MKIIVVGHKTNNVKERKLANEQMLVLTNKEWKVDQQKGKKLFSASKSESKYKSHSTLSHLMAFTKLVFIAIFT